MMLWIRKIAFILLLCLLPVLIVGCGANEKEKKAMFQSLKKENLIVVGEADFDDYVEVKTVSNAPVPGSTNYYIYEYEDTSYSICFEGYMEDDEKVFRAAVEETTKSVEISKSYYFQKTFLGKMKLTKSKFSFFSKDFTYGDNFVSEDNFENPDDFENPDGFTGKNDSLDVDDFSNETRFGIEKIYYNGSVLSVRIFKEADWCEDDRLLQYAEAGLENPENVPDIVCNFGGQDYQAEKVAVDEYADSYVIKAEFEQMEPAQPIRWQCGEIVIELGK